MAEQEKQEETSEPEARQTEGGASEAKDASQPQGAAPAEGRQKKETAAAPAAERRPARPGEGASPAGPSTAVVPAGRQVGQPAVSRRSILRFGFWSGLGAMLAGMAACGVDLLYPRGVTGFGGRVSVEPGEVPQPGEKRPIQRGRFWLVNLTEEQGGPGLLALWWKCPHLGCTVPWKETFIWPDPTTGADKQGWFRCPCHGSTYTDAGIRVFGPAPRSLDTMKLEVGSDGRISVDTGSTTNGGPDNPDRAVHI